MGGILVIMLGLFMMVAIAVFFVVIVFAFTVGAFGFAEETRRNAAHKS